MTNFDTVLSRFPSVAQNIFKELDSKSLIKCRKASFLWQNFIDNEKFIWIRRMQKYNGNMEEFYEQWKLVIRKTPIEVVEELSKTVMQFFKDNISRIERQYAPLHIAAMQGLLGLSKFVIQKTGDKNPARCDGTTALHMAAITGQTEVCRYLTDMVDDKNPADNNGITPLHDAAYKGNFEVYQLIGNLLEDKNPSDNRGFTPLHLASQNGHLKVCKFIMETLVDKNPQRVGGQTPYHNAANSGRLDICKLFLENLPNKNPNTYQGHTPLHFAAGSGHLKVCKVILESVDDKNPVGNNGDTPLDKAAREGQLEIIRLLIDYGVDRRRIYRGWSPIKIAASHGHFRSCAFLIESFQDILSFFKGILNYHSSKSAGLCLVLLGALFGAIIMIIFIYITAA